ncbi:dihydroorotase [candidate division KSB1 bacterium]|nr:dihydroorotase [candidate division KSB1 bacterium]
MKSSSMNPKYASIDHPAPARSIYFEGARLIDPRSGIDQAAGLLIRDGLISVNPQQIPEGTDRFDLRGHWITPGWFDLHVHLREPGREVAETIVSGCHAAMAGGFTGVACMPNTDPPLDNAGLVGWVRDQAKGLPIDVHVIAAATRERKGKELVDMSELVEAGVRAFTDDGSPIRSSAVLRHAMEYANMLGARIFEHAEDSELVQGGAMNESEWSTSLGLPGMPAIGETIDVVRCILISEYTGAAIHLCHVSTKESVHWIREAKRRGIRVTAEVCPHHLLLNDSACKEFDTNFKMNPPLRAEADRLACIEGFRDGTLDVYCTDHAPHPWESKAQEFDVAPFGVVGLETAMGIALTHFVPTMMDLNTLLERVVYAPRAILAQPVPSLVSGAPANLTLIDPDATMTVDPATFRSRSRNTAFAGWPLKGKAMGVVNRGLAYIA